MKSKNLFQLKKSQSEVISTVLLILLVVVLIFVIIGFLIPFVKDRLKEADCINLVDKIEIKENPKYTCYDISDTSNKNLRVQVFMGDIQDKIEKFIIEAGGAETNSVEVIDGSSATSEICMYDKTSLDLCSADSLKFPGKNEQRTYLIKEVAEQPDTIKVYPVLKGGKTCNSYSVITSVPKCES